MSGGRSSYKTEEIFLESDVIASSVGFLDESQEIQLNEEIPVAVMAYDSKTGMKNFTLQDFFDPSAFEGLDLVQAVTLMFSDEGE